MKKIYCKECKFPKSFNDIYYCKNPQTFLANKGNLYYEKTTEQQWCRNINRNNDCKFFKKKEGKKDILRKLFKKGE